MVYVLPGPIATASYAIAGRLKYVFPEDKFPFRWLPAQMTKTVWETLIQRSPSVNVQWAGFRRAENSAALIGMALWNIYLPVKNNRDAGDLLLGDKFGLGALAVAQVAMAALHGMSLFQNGQRSGTLVVTDCQNVVFEERDDPGVMVPCVTVAQHGMQIHVADVMTADIFDPAMPAGSTIAWIINGATTTDITGTT
ncbi:MAG TPA: hypothetical protein PLO69_11070 [Gammaproteobacteria bacterium]|nr:hypothetical protein [Gammaproteobacteria bacterium]